MFESAELGHKVSKSAYASKVAPLRESLLDTQYDFIEKSAFPIIILVGGVDGAGKGETVNLLNEWMDPRHIQTHAMGSPSDEERERPTMYRYWRVLPPKGTIGIFCGSWYTAPILERVYGKTNKRETDEMLEDILRFEKMLTDEGALIIKFWMHLSKRAQKKRLKALESDPYTAWRVNKTDWKHFRLYDEFRKVSERALRRTSTGDAPWIVVEGADARYRSLTVGTAILSAMRTRLDRPTPRLNGKSNGVAAAPLPTSVDKLDVLRRLDLTKKLRKPTFDEQLLNYQAKLNGLSRRMKDRHVSAVVVFEGNDAAGKGGAIRRITSALDARSYTIFPTAAPAQEERAQPYLWRFWRHVPRRGKFAIFDRSWYGRVLVERVEGFASVANWMRAYSEINDFEGHLVDAGTVVVKFWLSISRDEQLRRFKDREKTGFKRFKITDEDWRNRKKWDAYEIAVSDMVDRTSTEIAPWTLVPANDKYYARIMTLKTLCARIEEAL
jgi:polyphosphate:AMP phosphotransferase